MPEVQNVSLAGGQIAPLQAVTQLTGAQILTLNTVPVRLVAAPGAGKLIVVFGVAFVYAFGTVAYTAGGSVSMFPFYAGSSGDNAVDSFNNLLLSATSSYVYQSGHVPPGGNILPGDDNQQLQLQIGRTVNVGPIVTTTLGAGGAGYAANDTGTITTGNGDATYKVLTVGGGGNVLTYQITAPGTLYAIGNGQATATGGAQPGVGVGFTVNITAVQTGDGTLKVVTYYQIIAVP